MDRIVIPKEICKVIGIEPKDSLEIFIDDDKIVLGKYAPACIFCFEANNVVRFKDKLICEDCLKELSKLIKK